MKIHLATPPGAPAHSGNRVTADRWTTLLTALGHDVAVGDGWEGHGGNEGGGDVLVALHARHSAAAVVRWREERGDAPLVVALTGTDLYRDLADSPETQRSIALADRLVVLQPLAVDALGDDVRSRVRVIYQSVELPSGVLEARASRASTSPAPEALAVCVLANLRAVKDPLLAAAAVRLLPANARVRVTHYGAALDDGTAEQAAAATGPRYVWRGAVPRDQALTALANSAALVLTSRLEGGANAVSEALALGVPILSTRIPGSVGLLGDDYPGYFPVGDAAALAGLLRRAETDPGFLAELADHVRARAWVTAPTEERRRWAALLAEL